jgi:hypothetical protein
MQSSKMANITVAMLVLMVILADKVVDIQAAVATLRCQITQLTKSLSIALRMGKISAVRLPIRFTLMRQILFPPKC